MQELLKLPHNKNRENVYFYISIYEIQVFLLSAKTSTLTFKAQTLVSEETSFEQTTRPLY